tara:strand:+ start:246 stop:656 length:411 start_codon:yes stop_codon:yes gene_type:complete
MTHPPEDSAIRAAMESLIENGLDGMGEAIRILMNEAMKIERTDFLQATPYERSEDRVGHANGFKDKTVRTRIGEVTLQVPQVRGLPADLVGFSIRARWRRACAASERSNWPLPRCMCRASLRAKSPKLRKSYVAWK